MSELVTGFPGFIGRRLVAALLEADAEARVAALVEPRMLELARTVADRIDPERIELVAGDITDRRLGLEDADYERLAGETRRVFHLAAIYDLAVPLEVAQRVNVDGTGNVLDFCAAARGLERLAYVSTAYVAGTRTGVVYEHELVMGQGFKNHYESTKFQAEVWVRELLDRVPTTILRPAIVVGDSRTGETEKFDGPYYVLRALGRSQRMGRPLPQFGRSAAAFNVVPVDYVVEAMVAAAGDQATLGETLHLVDPDPLSAHDLVELLSRLYTGTGTRGRVPAAMVERSLRLKRVREMFEGIPAESIAYLNHPVVYDARRTVDLLAPHGLVPPRFPDYAEAVVGFYREHEGDPALRPKPPA
ncbi:MAG TPA: SDR family oxidoreductase [Solirubrobacterales bacterium]|nr:SDR family oxidoreductase [Solirubrobacterales bacterium]